MKQNGIGINNRIDNLIEETLWVIISKSLNILWSNLQVWEIIHERHAWYMSSLTNENIPIRK